MLLFVDVFGWLVIKVLFFFCVIGVVVMVGLFVVGVVGGMIVLLFEYDGVFWLIIMDEVMLFVVVEKFVGGLDLLKFCEV